MMAFIAQLLAFFCAFTAAKANPKVLASHAFGTTKDFEERGLFESTVVLDPTQREQIKELITNGGFYRIRLDSENEIVSAIHACELYKAGFKEEIVFHVDNDGNVVGIDYSAPLSVLSARRDCKKPKLPENIVIQTNVQTRHPTKAQSVPVQVVASAAPPGLQNLQKNVKGQDGPRKPAGVLDIFKKYWYIIVPLFVMLTMGGGNQPPAQGAAAPSRK
mmetsp:Transcript_20312/g.30023  ORF Transcript_20312/g.30023 Transcript_20312/m.30023 type:complete len:218 (+) Transcript_20312:38-691(+)